MIEKGQKVILTYKIDDSVNTGDFIYLGKGIVDGKFLFLRYNDSFTMLALSADELINAKKFENTSLDGKIEYFGLLDVSSEEKFRYWYMNLESIPSAPKNLYNYERRLAFKLFSFDQFKEYFMTDSKLQDTLVYILLNNCNANNLDKFMGYDESITRCLSKLKPKNEKELINFIDFVNLNLKKDKRVTGLNSQDKSYFYRLANVIACGADYNDYPRSKIKPALMKCMWESSQSPETFNIYLKLLNSELEINDVYTILNNFYITIFKLTEEQLNVLLTMSDNIEEVTDILASISKYNYNSYHKPYKGDFNLEIVTKSFEELLASKEKKDDLSTLISADDLFM